MNVTFGWIRVGGLVVAVIGFAITRIFIAETIEVHGPLSVTLISLIPLIIGLALTIYGIALAVGPFSRAYVAKVARWCLIGTAGMMAIVLVTMSELILSEGWEALLVDDSLLLIANVLLGGAVSGVIIGDRSAANLRHQREIGRQANRGRMLTRLLRHEVINAATIIAGYASTLDDDVGKPKGAIQQETKRITETVNEVDQIASDPIHTEQLDLVPIIEEEVAHLRERFQDTDISIVSSEDSVSLDADDRIRIVIRELVENTCEHSSISTVQVEVTKINGMITLSISDDGPGLPSEQRTLLESRSFPEFDDPSAGFGLQIVRLLVSKYDGEIQVGQGLGEAGSTIEISFPQHGYSHTIPHSVSLAFSNLLLSMIAGVVAGLVMGLYFGYVTDQLPIIGALYGVENPIIGWIAHLFHSIVFGLMFVAGLSHPALHAIEQRPVGIVAAAIGWGSILWLFAAGMVMPFWLSMIGESAMVPTLSPLGLVSHLLWGIVLGLTIVGLRVLYRN